MNFPTVIEGTCPSAVPWRPDNDVPILVLKPETATGCAGSIQFQGFLQSQITGETALTSGVVFQSSNVAVVAIDSTTGLAVLISAGQATITAAYGLLSAQSVVTVQGTGSDCCETVLVATEVAVDNSKSMSQLMSGGLARLDFAKQAAKKFFEATRWDKDTAGLMRFSSAPILIQAISTTSIENATVDGIPQTINQTDILAGLLAAIAAVSGVTADRRVILLVSDGEHRPLPNGIIPSTAAVLAAAGTFKSGSGIIIGVGCAAAGDGYALMQSLATPGFFVNAYDSTTAAAALQELGAMLCYYCAGTLENCCIVTVSADGLVPTMTSNTAPSGTVSTNFEYETFDAWKTFDRDENTYWIGRCPFGTAPSPGEWIQYEFAAPQTVSSYSIRAPYHLVQSYVPMDWEVQGSTDGVTWNTVDVRSQIPDWEDNVAKLFTIASPQSFAFWRILFQQAGGLAVQEPDLATFAISEIQFFGDSSCVLQAPGAAQVPNPDQLPDLELSTETLFTSTKTACKFCPLVGGEQTSAEGEAQITSNANRKIFNWDNPGTPSGCVVAESNLHVGAHYTLRGSASSLVGTINSGTVVVTGVVTIEGYLAFSIPDAGGFAFFQLDLLNTGPISTELVVTGASLAVYPSVQRCATRSASSYVDQATADALALAAVTAAAQALCDIGNNDQPIQFANGTLAPATLYPSVKVVSGFVGVIAKVTLTLFQVRHFLFDNVGLVLQSPGGTAVMLLWLGDAASQTVVNPAANIIFDDDAATALPDDNPLAGGTYKPTVLESGETVQFPVPAPTQPYGVVLSDFIGENPNGNWRLWCIHSGFYTFYNPANATIIGGFDLTIT